MATVERTCVIAAAPDAVWTVLADFDAISTWAPNVDHSCAMSDQRSGVGAVRRIQTDRATVVETVEEWDPERTLSYRISGLPSVFRSVTNTWRLSPVDASTEVRLVTEIDAGQRPPQQFVATLIGKRFGSASDQMLDGLTRRLDSTPATGVTT